MSNAKSEAVDLVAYRAFERWERARRAAYRARQYAAMSGKPDVIAAHIGDSDDAEGLKPIGRVTVIGLWDRGTVTP